MASTKVPKITHEGSTKAMRKPTEEQWDVVIQPSRPWWKIDLREIWHYRDLLLLLARRDLLAVYKQTLIGPLWQVIQPLLTSVTFAVVFGGMARLSTPGIPPMLFYLAGVVPWTLFANLITRTSNTLVWNSALMTKVYFPRLVAPLATTLSTMVNFLVQLMIFFVFAGVYKMNGTYAWTMSSSAFFMPLLVVLLVVLAFGLGIIVAALTTKYRDFTFLITFGLQLLMFASPVVFPLDRVAEGSRLRTVIELNPMTSIIEGFRAMLLNMPMDWWSLTYTAVFSLVTLLVGLALFQRVERSFADVV